MNRDEMEAKSEYLETIRLSWQQTILPQAQQKIADAHAHAAKALTDSLKQTPDGRASLLALNRSPSFKAAINRLNECLAWLAGPSEVSLEGAIRDARESFYRAACHQWFPLIPTNILSRSTEAPNQMQINRIRAAAIHGYDPRKYLLTTFETAKQRLKASIEQSARRGIGADERLDTLAAWQTATTTKLNVAIVTLLNDSVEYADRAAGHDLIGSEFVEEYVDD